MHEQSPPPAKRKPLAFIPLLVFGAIACLFAFSLLASPPESRTASRVGESAPDYSFPLLAEKAHTKGEFSPVSMRGRAYVINFFASWCMPCRAEHPLLQELAKEKGVELIGIAYKDFPRNLDKFLLQMGNPFSAVAVDTPGRGGIEWGLTGVPETYVIDASGVIAWHHVGPLTEKKIAEGLLPTLAALREQTAP
ncbi:MAG: DsbE family thiol:disulfide interchange protein [Alphaproteobacteria bacterium]|nr:DsbE family thiol:disulfide interchange protein [Alphaproteobacteria bacterium]